MNSWPSIFNDVIGPVMRGPSSSHTAASWRIARIASSILNEPLQKAIIDFDKDGAWASNYREQGTSMGIEGGLLDLDITDDRMKDTEGYARASGIAISYQINSFLTDHVNTVRLNLQGISGKALQLVGVSLGGGSFEVREINGFRVNMSGNCHELLMFSVDAEPVEGIIKTLLPGGIELNTVMAGKRTMFQYKSSYPVPDDVIGQLSELPRMEEVLAVPPVMPILAGKGTEMPFSTLASLLDYADNKMLDLGELGLIYEGCVSGLHADELSLKMVELVGIIDKSIETGLAGTHYEDRILQQQSHLVEQAEKQGEIPTDPIINRIIANVSALMESKSALEVIVAAPTAGSCGTLGGTLRSVADHVNASTQDRVKAFYAAGIIGAYFAKGPGFSAEEHGCQVECGAASGMAAAGVVQLLGGSAKQAIGAASMAIQNMIGLVCDPVADRVEIPCLGKNISAAVNAYSSALMSKSGFEAIIPLDQVIQTVSNVSKLMPTCVKCTGKGGLALTKTALELKEKLNQ